MARVIPWLVAAAALAAAPVAAQAQGDPDAFTPVQETVLAPPQAVPGSDGRKHLVYEVELVNVSSLPWRITALEVRAGARATRTLAAWRGPRVRTVIAPFGRPKPSAVLEPGQAVVAHLQLSLPANRAVPARLQHRLVLENTTRPVVGPPRVTQTGGATRVIRTRPVVLGPPLEGERWIAADGCCTAHRHVWATQPFGGGLFTAQRFAIDWEMMDEQGRLFTGDKRVLTNWPAYGKHVLAVADGTVVHAVDDQPDQVPGRLPTGLSPAQADGNGVILRIAPGRYVFYAHMIPGSLRVRVGDRVRQGQVIGLLGNSGNSTAPHLHLHVVDRNAILGANGLPYVFRSFDITGKVASTAAFDHAEATGEPVRFGPVRTGERRLRLPMDQVIVTWPSP